MGKLKDKIKTKHIIIASSALLLIIISAVTIYFISKPTTDIETQAEVLEDEFDIEEYERELAQQAELEFYMENEFIIDSSEVETLGEYELTLTPVLKFLF